MTSALFVKGRSINNCLFKQISWVVSMFEVGSSRLAGFNLSKLDTKFSSKLILFASSNRSWFSMGKWTPIQSSIHYWFATLIGDVELLKLVEFENSKFDAEILGKEVIFVSSN